MYIQSKGGKMGKNKIYPKEVKAEARNLRNRGWSLGEISARLKMPKNTISGWVKDIELTKRQKQRIKEKIIASGVIGRPLAVKANLEKIEKWKEGIKEKVRRFGEYCSNNPKVGKLICGLLYLCEGAKYPATRGLIFINSDPMVIYYFLNLLRRFFNIKEDKLRCRVMHRWDQDSKRLKRYWSKLTGIPLKHFFNNKPDIRTKGKPTMKVNYKGVCAIQYSDTSLQFTLQSIGEVIIKNGAGGIRTLDPLNAIEVRSQLRYGPIFIY